MISVVATGRRMKTSEKIHDAPARRACAGWRLGAPATPGVSRSWPSVTTTSPALSPARDDRLVAFGAGDRDRPHFDLAIRHRPRTRTSPCCPACTASDGTTTACGFGAEKQASTSTNWPGHRRIADVVERGLQLDRARLVASTAVVDERQAAVGRGSAVGPGSARRRRGAAPARWSRRMLSRSLPGTENVT